MTFSYGLIADIVLILIFAISILAAWKRGFFLSLMDFIAVAAACAASVWLSGIIVPQLYEKLISPAVLETVSSALESCLAGGEVSSFMNEMISSSIGFTASSVGADISAALRDTLSSSLISAADLAVKIEQSLIAPIVKAICTVVIFLLLFIILLVLLKIAVRFIKSASQVLLPPLKRVDGFLGACFGALKGAFWVVIFSALAFFIADLGAEKLPDFTAAVEQSKLIGLINGFNPIVEFLSL